MTLLPSIIGEEYVQKRPPTFASIAETHFPPLVIEHEHIEKYNKLWQKLRNTTLNINDRKRTTGLENDYGSWTRERKNGFLPKIPTGNTRFDESQSEDDKTAPPSRDISPNYEGLFKSMASCLTKHNQMMRALRHKTIPVLQNCSSTISVSWHDNNDVTYTRRQLYKLFVNFGQISSIRFQSPRQANVEFTQKLSACLALQQGPRLAAPGKPLIFCQWTSCRQNHVQWFKKDSRI